MKIGVLMKRVPDSDSRITVRDPAAGVDLASVTKWVVNPYDEFAAEAAIQLKEQGIGSEVVLFTVGSAAADKQIRTELARGGDRAVRIDGPSFGEVDALGVARALAAAIQQEGVQLVLCGKQAIDGDSAQVPGMVAELLGWPQVTGINGLVVEGESIKARRPVGGGTVDVVQTRIPAVLSCDKGLNNPRFPKLPAIMKAKKKPLDVRDAKALGLSPEALAPVVNEGNWGNPPARPSGRILQGDTAAVVAELVQLLRDEAKVI
jgi:electron transfer flavoprotein beta subunit